MHFNNKHSWSKTGLEPSIQGCATKNRAIPQMESDEYYASDLVVIYTLDKRSSGWGARERIMHGHALHLLSCLNCYRLNLIFDWHNNTFRLQSPCITSRPAPMMNYYGTAQAGSFPCGLVRVPGVQKN